MADKKPVLYKLQPKNTQLFTVEKVPFDCAININGQNMTVKAGSVLVTPQSGGEKKIMSLKEFEDNFARARENKPRQKKDKTAAATVTPIAAAAPVAKA